MGRYYGVLDCNNFFVSCERLFRPDLLKRPVAVLSSNDGCVVARSEEIKAMGISMGVPYFQVKDICDKGRVTLFSSNFTLYRDISDRVMQALKKEVGEIEKYSIDEAFFTISTEVTKEELFEIRKRIIQTTGIPVSIGLGETKTIAKIASKMAKKGDGVFVFGPDNWQRATMDISCGEVWGLGRQATTKLKQNNINTVKEFIELPLDRVRKLLGVMGERIQFELRGVSVHQPDEHKFRLKQSITSTRSFAKVITNRLELESIISSHVALCASRLRKARLLAGSMTIILRASRFSDFAHRKGSEEVLLSYPSAETSVLTKEAIRAVRNLYESGVPYKKAGIVMGDIVPFDFVSQTLFSDKESLETDQSLDSLTDSINQKFDGNLIHLASDFNNNQYSKAKLRSQSYTTKWKDIPSVKAK